MALFKATVALLAAATHSSALTRAAQKVTPVEKVIDLLKNLQAKVEAEGKTDAEQYDKFACFCKEQADNKQYAIEKSTEKIASLTAKATQLGTEISELNSQISTISASIKAVSDEIKAAADVRAKEHADYLVQEKDAADAIKALENAIEALKDSKSAMSGAKVDFVQVRAAVSKAASRSGSDMSILAELLQNPASYEFQGNDIIATLQGMLKTFNENKKQLDIDEFDTQAAFDRRNLDLTNQKKFQSKDKAQLEKVLESKTAELNGVNQDTTQETKDLKADQTFLGVVVQECEAKAQLWDQRSKLRSGELTALAEALDVLTTKVAAAYGANDKLNLAQLKSTSTVARAEVAVPQPSRKGLSFLQVRDTSKASANFLTRRAANLLERAATRLHSQVLSTVAARMFISADPFAKVRSLVKDLIAKLEEDKEAEATQKAFCDEAMAGAISSRDKSKAEIETLHASKSALTAEKAELAQQIATLSQAIANLKKGLLEATELRKKESAENAETVDTATQGKSAVELALKVLNEFYGKASFLQIKYVPEDADREGNSFGDLAPAVFSDSYGGSQKSANGILGLLEVILSDFERTIDTVTSQEKQAQADYDEYQASTEADVKDKADAVETARARVSSIEDSLVATADKLTEQEALLGTAEATLLDLKAQCVDQEESYEEKRAKRKNEIEALKQAKAILDEY